MGKPILPVLAPGERYERAVPPQLLDRLVIDAGRTPIAEVAARVVAAATNTSVDAALSQVHSQAQQRQRRLAFAALIFALIFGALAVVTNYQRSLAIAVQREAEAARDRILALTSQGALALAPDGKAVAVGGVDGSVRLLDLQSGRLVGELRLDAGPVNSLAYSPDGRILAVAAGHDIRLWEVATARWVLDIRGHTDEILAVQFLPDGRFLVSRSIDGTVRVWDASTGHELARISHQVDRNRFFELGFVRGIGCRRVGGPVVAQRVFPAWFGTGLNTVFEAAFEVKAHSGYWSATLGTQEAWTCPGPVI